MDIKQIYHSILTNKTFKAHPKFIFACFSKLSTLKISGVIYSALCSVNPKNKRECEESEKYFLAQIERIKENLSFLADEKSKTVYKEILKYRCTNKYKHIQIAAENPKNQYIDNVVFCSEEECLVDVGAFFGESTIAFEKYIAGKNNKKFSALLIEADEFNLEICKENLKHVRGKFIFELCAAGEESGVAKFQSGLFVSSRIDALGDALVDVCTVDELCRKNNIKPTYIKYDIEGVDLGALKGSDETIRQYRPKLAVSIYHSDEDMVECIQTIKSKYEFYDLYVRHYSRMFADTVLYCIPK